MEPTGSQSSHPSSNFARERSLIHADCPIEQTVRRRGAPTAPLRCTGLRLTAGRAVKGNSNLLILRKGCTTLPARIPVNRLLISTPRHPEKTCP